MSFDEPREAHCACCHDWEQKVSDQLSLIQELSAKLSATKGREEQAVGIIAQMLAAVKSEPAMNNHKYDGLGIEVNRFLANYPAPEVSHE